MSSVNADKYANNSDVVGDACRCSNSNGPTPLITLSEKWLNAISPETLFAPEAVMWFIGNVLIPAVVFIVTAMLCYRQIQVANLARNDAERRASAAELSHITTRPPTCSTEVNIEPPLSRYYQQVDKTDEQKGLLDHPKKLTCGIAGTHVDQKIQQLEERVRELEEEMRRIKDQCQQADVAEPEKLGPEQLATVCVMSPGLRTAALDADGREHRAMAFETEIAGFPDIDSSSMSSFLESTHH